MPRLKKRTLIAAKLETAEGTYTDPVEATDVLFLVQDVNFKAEPTIITRDFIGPSFDAKGPAQVVNKLARITFRTEVMGAGAAGSEPKWATFLKACGLSTTINVSTDVQYKPVVPSSLAYDATGANGNTTISIQVHEDGISKAARGCRGTFKITGESANLAYIDWEFLGIWQAAVDVTYPGLSTGFDNQTPPIVELANFSFHGITASTILFRTFNIDWGNILTPRFDANTSSGLKAINISDRKTTATIDPEAVTKADWSTEATERLMVGTTGAFTLTIGTVAGNKVTFNAPANLAQITAVDEAERDSILTNNLTFAFNHTMVETTDAVKLTVL